MEERPTWSTFTFVVFLILIPSVVEWKTNDLFEEKKRLPVRNGDTEWSIKSDQLALAVADFLGIADFLSKVEGINRECSSIMIESLFLLRSNHQFLWRMYATVIRNQGMMWVRIEAHEIFYLVWQAQLQDNFVFIHLSLEFA